MQELANPTVEAPGKGYIGKYAGCQVLIESKVHQVDMDCSVTVLLYQQLLGFQISKQANTDCSALSVSLSVPNVDLPPLCSSRFRPGPPGEQAQAASQFIADVIERCNRF